MTSIQLSTGRNYAAISKHSLDKDTRFSLTVSEPCLTGAEGLRKLAKEINKIAKAEEARLAKLKTPADTSSDPEDSE